MSEKHLTKIGINRVKYNTFTQENISLSELSTSIKDFETLKSIRKEPIKRITVLQLDKEFLTNTDTYYLVLRNGMLLEIDDIEKEFKDPIDDTISPENTKYIIYQDIVNHDFIPADVSNLNHDNYLNIITTKNE